MERQLVASSKSFLMTQKLILNEDFDKIANDALSEIQSVREIMNNVRVSTATTTASLYDNSNTQTKISMKSPIFKARNYRKNYLLKRYFAHWKNYWLHQKEVQNQIERRNKLDKLVKSIKNQNKLAKSQTLKLDKNSGDSENVKPQEVFKNRYTKQQCIIQSLKEQLDLQNKLISELKLGVIKSNIIKSITNFKHEIGEIFSDKSNLNLNAQTKSSLLIAAKAGKRLDNFLVSSKRKPKHLKRLEERARERQNKREAIMQRKAMKEKERQLELEKALAEKKTAEKEVRKRNLEILKENLRRRTEMEKARAFYMEKVRKANKFYANSLLKRGLIKLKSNCNESLQNSVLAHQYFDSKLKEKYFYLWLSVVNIINRRKRKTADNYYNKCIQRIYFKKWLEVYKNSLKLAQTAADFYNFILQDKAFRKWKELIIEDARISNIKMEVAKLHDEKRLKFNYFFMWRSYPAIKRLEKAKEEKKHKWREMVWKILPNFKPRPLDD